MVTIDAHIIDKLRRFIERSIQSGVALQEAYLFGSYAKGTATEGSDIDIAIITSRGKKDADLLWMLRRPIDVLIEPVVFSPDRFSDESPLAWEIKKHGIQIVDHGKWTV